MVTMHSKEVSEQFLNYKSIHKKAFTWTMLMVSDTQIKQMQKTKAI